MTARSLISVLTLAIVTPGLGLAAAAQKPDGKALYEKKCVMCHGKNGVAKTMAKGSANLNDPEWQTANSADDIVKVVAAGKNKMPAYEDRLAPPEIRAIADYVKTLR